MERLIKKLRSDEELTRIRKEWIEKTDEPFPLFNFDQYSDIDDYKEKLKKRFEAL